MRKTFPLSDPKHKPARVLEKIKHEVRKYLKRERRKPLPDEADYWAFDCQVGRSAPERTLEVKALIDAIDEAGAQGWETIYIEILARPAARAPRDQEQDEPDA